LAQAECRQQTTNKESLSAECVTSARRIRRGRTAAPGMCIASTTFQPERV
jgi:hypothetical protein